MLELSAEDYSRLESAVVDVASGSELSPKSASRRSYGVDSNGDRIVTTQVQESKPPDIKLALALLSERIGGPQDYC